MMKEKKYPKNVVIYIFFFFVFFRLSFSTDKGSPY